MTAPALIAVNGQAESSDVILRDGNPPTRSSDRQTMKTLNLALAIFISFAAGCTTDVANETSPAADGVMVAARIARDFEVDANLSKAVWRKAPPVTVDRGSRDAIPHPALATTVRAIWSDEFLYLAYDCPFTELAVFDPVQTKERFGLWERDVVEAFIGSDPSNIRRYTEYEVSPTNERLDVKIPEKDFAWSSRFESATRVDRERHRWVAELRIPLGALSDTKPRRGTRWRINLYRCDYANKAFLAFRPTLTGTFHTPERFGALEFR